MDKGECRKFVMGARAKLTEAQLVDMSNAVLENLVVQPAFMNASAVACYLDVGAEVKTFKIIERCWAEGKSICVPAYDNVMKIYRLAHMDANTELTRGQMNINEPSDPVWMDAGDVDLFLVPGLAFDDKGGRVGYGGGCYDRIMSGTRGVKAALTFDFQVFEQVPVEEHDILLNMIITETRIITVS